MDSEQIKKDLENEALFSISGPFHPGGKGSIELVQDHRKLKGQVVAEPAENSVLTAPEYPGDPWDLDSVAIEQKLGTDINKLLTEPVGDKIELKKGLSDIYKQAHDLMTRYNQRIQSLLMDDRFLYRHSSEISALMIRGLMPPLEAMKTLEKSLTSTRKKATDEPIDALQKSATAPLEQVGQVLKDSKNRLARYTKPLKPEQLIQKQLDKRLEQEASELHQQVQVTAAASEANSIEAPDTAFSTKSTPFVNTPPKASPKPQPQAVSAEDLTSRQLQTLAIKLSATAGAEGQKRTIQAILRYVESEYQRYAPLRPVLSVAIQKCELLSMNPDKACNACQDAIELLKNTATLSETPLSLDTLLQVDTAINRLASFDKKLPGEVWQLLTELTPYQGGSRYHLANMLCRKLLLDGPTQLTQKVVLNKFRDVQHYLSGCQEKTSDVACDQHFMAVCGPLFTHPGHLKKTLNTMNKPHELDAVLQVLSRQKKSERALLSETIEKHKSTADEQLDILVCGASAFDFLVTELPEQLSSEIRHHRPSEADEKHEQLTQSVLTKYTEYCKAVELAGKLEEPSHQTDQQSGFEYKEILSRFNRKLAEILIVSDERQAILLQDMDNNVATMANAPLVNDQAEQTVTACRKTIVQAVVKAFLTDHQKHTIIKLFLETQALLAEPGTIVTEHTAFQVPEELVKAMASLQSGASPKWYNQQFTGQLLEQRILTLGTVRNLLDACQQAMAAPAHIADFIEITVLAITEKNDDPLIRQLGSEMQVFAGQLKTP